MRNIFLFLLCAALVSCATTESGDAISLDEAIEQSAAEIAAELPEGTRVAIVGFSSEHESLSEYIMDELTGALVDGGLEVADRRNLAFVYKELNFQMSGDVSEESAVSIGKFLGASHVIFGQLINAGGSRRYRLSGVNAETAVQESSTRLSVRGDRALRSLIAAVKKAPAAVTTASYGESGSSAPKTAGAFFDRALLSQNREEYDNAIADYTEALRIDPNFVAAYHNRGGAYYNKGDYDRAIADYTAALRIDPDYAYAYNNRGIAYAGKEDYDRAIADHNQAIKFNPDYAYAYNNRGNAYANKEDYDRAIADFNQAIKINPDNAAAYNNRGIAYKNKGDYDRAIADYTAALRIDPDNAYAYNNRGIAYNDKGDYDRAIADYTAALRINPDYANAYNNRGNAYCNKCDYERD
jgi:tetratricopeptide (TPR) repeat protein